jgi:tetratricopeptide (TPR) repeat protein
VAYLDLANVLHRSRISSDAVLPLKMAIEISPDVNILHYTLGNVYVSLAKLNESIPEYRYSLSLEPTSEPVLSVYSSVLCEIRKIDASMEYGRKLDETQAKLDEFYDKVELVKKAHVVEKGHRGQWDIDTTSRRGSDDDREKEERENESFDEEVTDKETEGTSKIAEQTSPKDNSDDMIIEELGSEDTAKTSDKVAPSVDGASSRDDSVAPSDNGTTDSVKPHNRGNSKLRLVLRPLCEEGCSKCGYDHLERPGFIPNSRSLDRFSMEQPVCRLPSPFLNYSILPSGYCAETLRDCAEIERRGRLGMNFCEVKGQSTIFSYTREGVVAMGTRSSLSCPVDDVTHHSDCLKKLQEELRLAEERRSAQREKMMKREKERRSFQKASPKAEKPEKPVPEPSSESPNPTPKVQTNPKNNVDNNAGSTTKAKESVFSKIFQSLEFLPYNPLPIDLDELIFPEKSRPLQIFDDPYWPSKSSCIRLVETLGTASTSFSSYTGTYLSPNAKGANTGQYFKIVPYPVPPYLRQQPRCTDIVELPFSLQAMDHLYPVQYRSQLSSNKKHSENGLKQVFINAISEAMGQTMSFEECGEAVYAAMVKNGPNWGLFVVASLYWRVSGDPKHSIECLRRALHYSSNIVKDVGYVALANVFHRHGYVKEAVIAARASLDVLEKSPVGQYTLAGIYLSLRDYTSASLHLRTALHLQPSFEHALSALRLVRCFLKFNEEYEQLQRKLSKPEGKALKAFESVLVTDMVTAIETLRSHERVRQPPNVTKPDDVLDREGRKSAEELFTGEDALKYITNLAILRNRRRELEAKEGESERRERKDIERRLREEMTKVENDGSLEEFLKRKRSEEGENEFEKKVHYEPNQLDITPLMQQVRQKFLFSTAQVPEMLEAKGLCSVFYNCTSSYFSFPSQRLLAAYKRNRTTTTLN